MIISPNNASMSRMGEYIEPPEQPCSELNPLRARSAATIAADARQDEQAKRNPPRNLQHSGADDDQNPPPRDPSISVVAVSTMIICGIVGARCGSIRLINAPRTMLET